MTAISPLQSFHKKGLFGDYHKKDQKDLINISELKNLTIVQVFKYKNSKIEIKSMQIDNLEIFEESTKVSANDKTRILWSGPNTWLIISSKENITESIKTVCNNENFAVTDISHSRSVIQIKGIYANEVIKKGCPLNFNNFSKNNCASSVFNGITIVVDCVDSDKKIFNLITLRSFGESFYHHITDASLEFGYLGV